jgi:hypothetical protein
MPNSIIYNVSTQSLTLKKGNFYIGTGDVGKGPTSTTGYFDGVSPASGGYVIYVRNSAGKNLIYGAPNDSQLILITNRIAGTSYTTVNECLVYFAGQTDKMVLNRNYESIVTNGLVLNLDAGFTPSYPRSNTTWYDISLSGNNGTLTNGPTYSSDGGGSIVFDGINDYVTLGSSASSLIQGKTEISIGILFKLDTLAVLRGLIGTLNYNCGKNLGLVASNTELQFYNDTETCISISIGGVIEVSKWIYAVGTYDGTTTRLYCIKNGVLSQSSGTTKTGPTNVFSSDFRIMGNQYSDYFTDGQGAIAFVYNRVLSEGDIQQNYNALKGRFGL